MPLEASSDSRSILPIAPHGPERLDKATAGELAIAGGLPAFPSTLHVGRPNIGSRTALRSRFDDILNTGWLTNAGPYLQEFELQVQERLKVKHCIATCNATIALQILLRTLEIKGQVIVPSFTFIATVNALTWEGLTPVFCDIDPLTHCLDPEGVIKLITPETKAILGVHLWGQPCFIDQLEKIASDYELHLLYDAAHAFLCTTSDGRYLGNFGLAEVISFHATKFVNTFEGGAIVTNDDDLAGKLRVVRNFGFVGLDTTECLGINAKMNEVSAAMGITSIESSQEFIEINKRNHSSYKIGLANLNGVKLLCYEKQKVNNHQYIVIEIDSSLAGASRDQILKALLCENVFARRYFFPGCHKMEPYQSDLHHKNIYLPITDRVAHSILLLPTGSSVNALDVNCVCNLMHLIIEYYSKW